MNRICSTLKLLAVLCTFLILTGCGMSGGTPEPIPVDLTLSTSENLNPDIENRASPIVIRIYQLSQIDTFNNGDFFALYENDKSLLANDLIAREELEIKPNQSFIRPLDIYPSSKYIAVLAAFRNLDKAQWKSFLEINPLKPQPLTIELEEFEVSISSNPKK